ACRHELCCEDEAEPLPFSSTTLRCDPCTDYLLVAETMVVVSRPADTTTDTDSPCWYMPTAFPSCLFQLTSTMAHLSPLPWSESGSRVCSVVLRC
ncbi:MAG TPA: hypothetical protein PLX97_16825, partial [Gemmatales bacterium]|nr:hypothetical protein [Gemmatales bacterium]